MGYIIDGLMEAIHLIVSLDPDVMEITALSLVVSLTATCVATIIALPVGTAVKFTDFRGKKVLINLIQTLYSLPIGLGRLKWRMAKIPRSFWTSRNGFWRRTAAFARWKW